MKRLLMAALCAVALLAQQGTVPAGKKIFIEKMPNDLNGYITAEMVKQKVRLEIVLDEASADLVMTGFASEEEKRKWHQGWLTSEQDRTAGNIMVIERSTKKLLWAGEAGDRSVWWGSMARGGHRKVAQRLVDKLKDRVK